MKTNKSSNLLSSNQTELIACVLILYTDKDEGEDNIYFQYKTNEKANKLIKLKDVILASTGISQSILGSDYEIMILESDIDRENELNFILKNENSCNTNVSKNFNYYTKFKVSSISFLKRFIISVVLPYSTQDNILKYICYELADSFSSFFESFESDEVIRNYIDVLNKYCENYLYLSLTYSIKKEVEDVRFSPLIHPYLCHSLYSFNNQNSIFQICPPISFEMKSEIIELINHINGDRSVLQETMTISDPPIYLKGVVLTYKGYTLYSSLSNNEFENLYRLTILTNTHVRDYNCPEQLIIDYLYCNNNVYIQDQDDINDKQYNSKSRRKIVATVLAQRDYVLYCYLDILCEIMNSSFDPFFHIRSQDTLLGILKRFLHFNINEELDLFGVKNINVNQNQRNIDNTTGISQSNQNNFFNTSSKLEDKDKDKDKDKNEKNNHRNDTRNKSKIQFIYDSHNKVNILHYSIFNESKQIINTCHINVDANTLQDIYRVIFKQYAIIQTNLNKLRKRSKRIKISDSFNLANSLNNYYSNLKLDPKLRLKIVKNNFLNNLSVLKIYEVGVKLKIEGKSIWVAYKIFELAQEDDTNNEVFICFVTYESDSMIDIHDFCTDLIISELFI